jgi:RNA methyltransferase, TrmH family, group 1
MAGTDRHRELLAEGPAIILVEPQLGENVGMVARAMANFGLVDLRLVNPREGWPNEKAVSAASKADHVIAATRVFGTLEEAMADLAFAYATTARQRDDHKPVRGPVEAGQELRRRHRAGQRTGILFGRERIGLRNEEITRVDEIVTFPVNPAYASLNIAQAVLLMSYEWMKSGLDAPDETPFSGPGFDPAPKAALVSFLDSLEAALDQRGYFRSETKRQKATANLREVFTRPGFSASELDVLRGIVASLDAFYRADGRMRDPGKPAAREADGEK